MVYIYEKCENTKNNHKILVYEEFKAMYYNDEYNNIDFNLYVFQRFYIKCLFEDNKMNNAEAKAAFINRFKDIDFKLSEYIVQNIKRDCGVNNLTLEQLCKSLTLNNDKIVVSIYPIKSEYTTRCSPEIKLREHNIIIIGHSNMLKYLNFSNAKMYSIDTTFKIIPKSFSPYKLMTIYAIDNKLKKKVILQPLFA